MTSEEKIKDQNDYAGITKWDSAGLTGEGINIWNTEGDAEHSQTVQRRIISGATKCNIFSASLSMSCDINKIYYSFCTYNGVKYDIEDFISKFNIKVVTRSVAGGKTIGGAESIFWNKLKDKYNLVFFNSAGNDGSDGARGSFPSDVAYYIAACTLDKHGKPIRANYSAIDNVVDFCTFAGVDSGTSFSAPYLAGIATRLKRRYNIDMSHEEVGEYLRLISEDMEAVGEDDYTGFGIPILPDVDKKYITLTIGSKEYFCNNEKYVMDTTPVLKNVGGVGGYTFVPVRAISEILDKKVVWMDKTKTITISDDMNTIVLKIGSNEVLINGIKMIVTVAPFIDAAKRTQVPLRLIAEAFNCKVGWVQKQQKILILES